MCVYFLALPVVGKPDPALGFLGSFRIVSGQFDAKSGPSLLSDMSDMIGLVYGPIHALEQQTSQGNNNTSTYFPVSALAAAGHPASSSDPRLAMMANDLGPMSMSDQSSQSNNRNNHKGHEAPNIDATIQGEFFYFSRHISFRIYNTI